ncbi:hypothetical protein M758_2G011400 [Ceratodon purpureus]|uniref:Uncharacterized protein n=1 Tax=Ceratodon purpureus TaxID=3225 RepID=A0A8T0IQX3_CERPU|nr:hypothetical protein KC19_2G012000 [Ceratodon purpureus]KAG0624881.1 hypothetical protein M758_2G011400 [Ceratodon purpureus]
MTLLFIFSQAIIYTSLRCFSTKRSCVESSNNNIVEQLLLTTNLTVPVLHNVRSDNTNYLYTSLNDF